MLVLIKIILRKNLLLNFMDNPTLIIVSPLIWVRKSRPSDSEINLYEQ